VHKPLACVVGDLSLIRALGRDGIPVAVATSEPESPTRRSRYCRAVVRTPSWVDDPEAALAALIAWSGEQRAPPVLFYQGDHDLLAVSRGRSRLAPLAQNQKALRIRGRSEMEWSAAGSRSARWLTTTAPRCASCVEPSSLRRWCSCRRKACGAG
jgi:hypothetical protein